MPRVFDTLCAAVALSLGSLSIVSCAKSDQAEAAERATPAPRQPAQAIHDPAVERSNAAVRVLVKTQLARNALAKNDVAGARANIISAFDALVRTGGVALVPIYSEVAQESFIGAIEGAKKEGAAKNGTGPVAVRAVAGGYSRILLDTSVARKQLTSARDALGRGDVAATDASLKMLQQSVVLESSTTRMPLVKARQNLSLAAIAAAHGNWPQAKAELQATSGALTDYAKLAPPADMADVRVLQRQIAGYANDAASQHDDAAARINGWWVQVAELTERRS